MFPFVDNKNTSKKRERKTFFLYREKTTTKNCSQRWRIGIPYGYLLFLIENQVTDKYNILQRISFSSSFLKWLPVVGIGQLLNKNNDFLFLLTNVRRRKNESNEEKKKKRRESPWKYLRNWSLSIPSYWKEQLGLHGRSDLPSCKPLTTYTIM